MKVSKRGSSLAVRLPAALVKQLDLREGDEVEIFVESRREFIVRKQDPSEFAGVSSDGSRTQPNHFKISPKAATSR